MINNKEKFKMISNKEKFTFLVVDDSDLIRNSLKFFFSDYNIEVLTSNDGLDGIQKAVKHKPALIFLDLMMPNFDGIKMLQVIKIFDDIKMIPVIVISGNANRINVLASLEAGAERVMSKPLKKNVMLKNINEILGTDFLKKAKKTEQISKINNNDITLKLAESFLKTFPEKKKIIENSLQNHNKTEIKNIAHELRGGGSMIGLPILSSLGGLLEDQLDDANTNWSQIRIMCDHVFAIVSNLKELNLKNTE